MGHRGHQTIVDRVDQGTQWTTPILVVIIKIIFLGTTLGLLPYAVPIDLGHLPVTLLSRPCTQLRSLKVMGGAWWWPKRF